MSGAPPGLPRSSSGAGLSSLSPDEAIHLLQSQVRGHWARRWAAAAGDTLHGSDGIDVGGRDALQGLGLRMKRAAQRLAALDVHRTPLPALLAE